MGRQSFEDWLDTNPKTPINRFYQDADGTIVYALYNHDGYVHFNDIAPHAEQDKMPVTEFHNKFKPERSRSDATE